MDRELLYRFFNGTASELERISIRKWAEAAPENMQELLKERKLYTAIILTGEREAFTSSKAPVGYKRSYFVRWGQYAAVFLCAVLLTWFVSNRMDRASSIMQIEVPLGQYMNLTLADGTNVYLNSGTVFKYPTAFTGKERKVEIDGEGFFKVTHQENDVPFIVKTSKGNVRVLGTKFNVEAYKEKDQFETSLIEGKVEVIVGDERVILNPNEKVLLVNGKLEKESLYDSSCYSWTSGIIEFNNIRFEDLMGEFEKIYGVRIVINNADLKDNLCLGKFRRIDGLDYALQVLQVDIPFEFQHDFETKTFYIN
ncbi:MAG TPA: FecR domain-containing protein [Candidatus Barnesiella excrementigallinarum]|nr:FecR domain-containing protein [Candidatus Barnesiella excrementigallinarum]